MVSPGTCGVLALPPSLSRYNAASPDEKALVEGAELYDCQFVERTQDSVTVTTCRGTRETYQVWLGDCP